MPTSKQILFGVSKVTVFGSCNCKRTNLNLSLVRHLCALPKPLHQEERPYVDYTNLSSIALTLYTSGLNAVSPVSMVKNALKYNQKSYELKVCEKTFKLGKNVHIVAFGKAITGMARTVEELLGDNVVSALAIIPDDLIEGLKKAGRSQLLPAENTKFQFLEGGDGSVSSEKSIAAAGVVQNLAVSLKENDILITLISGGGSELLALPKSPITLEDIQQMTRALKRCGISTLELNTVRKNLSLIKGGGLAEMAQPAEVIALILSNLPHEHAYEVASGPTTPDYSTPHQSLEIFRKYNVQNEIPQRILDSLHHDAKETAAMKWFTAATTFQDVFSGPKPRYDVSNALNVLVGSDEIAVNDILHQCSITNIPAYAIPATTKSDSLDNGRLFACVAQYVAAILVRVNRYVSDKNLAMSELECIQAGMTKNQMRHIAFAAEEGASMHRPVCLIFTSEITVELRKDHGTGGPCQEVALATAIELSKRYPTQECLRQCDVKLFSIDSDGIDGSSDVAGATADCFQALEKVNGLTAQQYLSKNDSNSFYKGHSNKNLTIRTGLTGTDIQNFQLLLVRNTTNEANNKAITS